MYGVSIGSIIDDIDNIMGKSVFMLVVVLSAYASWASGWNVFVLSVAFPTTIVAGVLIVIEFEKITSHVEEIIGKFVFLVAASVAVIALEKNNWDATVLVLSLPTIVLSGILVFVDFEELRFYLAEKTGFEMIKSNADEPLELTGGYDQLVELISKESTELALNLRRVQTNMEASDSFEALSGVIEDGISSDPIEETVNHLKHLLNIREYIEDPNRSELEIITLSGDDLLAESDGSGVEPVEGLMFRLHAEISITERGETGYFEKEVAMAKLTGISGEVYELSTYNWDSGGDADISELKSTLMDRDPYLEVNTDGLEDVEWEMLEDSYDFLHSVSTMEVTNAT